MTIVPEIPVHLKHQLAGLARCTTDKFGLTDG